MSEVLYTVGHGTLEQEAFVELLRGVGIRDVVDIRSYPGSRHNPQFGTTRVASFQSRKHLVDEGSATSSGIRAEVSR